MNCKHCFGEHEEDTPEIWVEWRGKKYYAPFLCLCCGKETCARQWAYGRSCDVCDTGLCQTDPKYWHPAYQPPNKAIEGQKPIELPLQDMISCGGCGKTTSRLSENTCRQCGRMMCGNCGGFCKDHKRTVQEIIKKVYP